MIIVSLRLKEFRKNATLTEKIIIDYILENKNEVTGLSVHDLAKKTYTSSSSIVRLCKKIGLEGYKDFIRRLLVEEVERKNDQNSAMPDVDRGDDLEAIISKVTHTNILSLQQSEKLVDPITIKKCINLIMNADKLVFFGMGASYLVAEDAQLKFTRVNKMSHVNRDWHVQLSYAKNLSSKDVGIVISYSGKTEEMVRCAVEVKESGAKLISITKNQDSHISDLSDYNLFIDSIELDLRSGAMSSRIAQLNIVDILYSGYINSLFDKSIENLTNTQIRKE